ncbi:GNAT family N-acetyltransferase [Salinibacillus xinjiangensis]|uniref:GNAT family N-acetyltransferase n=1 Tax=Salinibacillus xinjiangensis TaxID=1229268 RepID=A0A6G1X943_9BACI|nr:GNAT family N-acetyltransferase [Salinibacillus xinjiangensis]MRG87462.1 GNAT family N-acetyltransferase [Salinibacillus xinjiangensis]
MDKLTFEHIQTIGNVVNENELYKHYHYPEMLIRYDSNFIEFKRMPTISELLATEDFLIKYHKQYNQHHVKFVFPDNQKPDPEIMQYFAANKYDVGFLELYAIQPKSFPQISHRLDIEVSEVTDANLSEFLKLQYELDSEHGEKFAKEKVKLNKQQFEDESVMQVLAYYKGAPAGTMNVIVSEDFVEIDNLSVVDSLQRKGIGSRLQRFVMDQFPNETIILVAEGDDTPREMYQKQNYQYSGFQYEAIKIEK